MVTRGNEEAVNRRDGRTCLEKVGNVTQLGSWGSRAGPTVTVKKQSREGQAFDTYFNFFFF
jgi:hypothetical protein